MDYLRIPIPTMWGGLCHSTSRTFGVTLIPDPSGWRHLICRQRHLDLPSRLRSSSVILICLQGRQKKIKMTFWAIKMTSRFGQNVILIASNVILISPNVILIVSGGREGGHHDARTQPNLTLSQITDGSLKCHGNLT